jgi:hypothetical protein
MGGFGIFDLPSPSAPSPPPPATEPDVEEVARQKRLDALARKRRGLAGTVTTSPRGLLALSDWAPKRKSLLGE